MERRGQDRGGWALCIHLQGEEEPISLFNNMVISNQSTSSRILGTHSTARFPSLQGEAWDALAERRGVSWPLRPQGLGLWCDSTS